MNNLIMSHIESGQFDNELGEMIHDPANSTLKAGEIKGLLVDKILKEMEAEIDSGPSLWLSEKIGILIMLFAVLTSLILRINLREYFNTF